MSNEIAPAIYCRRQASLRDAVGGDACGGKLRKRYTFLNFGYYRKSTVIANIHLNAVLYIYSFGYTLLRLAAMQISIPDELKKQFHAACALRGLKMSHVVVELIKQWLASEAQSSQSQ
ncbi:MAG: hypothetical protein ACHBN1_31900 [Heteroscytonema crispum UTEX LB 1556]